MQLNQGLVNAARTYVNDVGPCDTDKTRRGQTLFTTIVPDFVNSYGELNGFVYLGKVISPKEIVVQMLASH